MRQVSLIAATTAFALLLGGCGNLFGGQDTAQQSPAPSASVAAGGSPSPQASPQTFPSPTVPQQAANGQGSATQTNPANPKGALPPDLIGSTDPNQRVRSVQSNRSDPFALLPTIPVIQNPNAGQVPETPAPAAPSTTSAASRAPSSRLAARSTSGSPAASSNSSSGGSRSTRVGAGRAPAPNRVPHSPVATAPIRPQPELAKAVKVTGVVQVGDIVYAIVNAPNEPSSRYVQAGQRLSNGQVLVRRIEVNRGEPVVVLEQYGVEVVTAVGEGGVPASGPAQPGRTSSPQPAAAIAAPASVSS
jgi:hypothetical protein